jgi:hypothetical protein
MDLVAALVKKQTEERLTERAFADKLGIKGGYWNMVKHGKRHIGRKALHGIVQAYPDLHPLVIKYHADALSEAVAA